MNARWSVVLLVALGGLSLLALGGASKSNCNPTPIEPFCESDDDCGPGAYCLPDGSACEALPPECAADADCGAGSFCLDGVCASWTACATGDECVEVPAGCCPCSMGGRSTAVNADYADLWRASLDCRPDTMCLAVYRCQDWTPACVDGACALTGGGIALR
jgi:Cys-rich repeat protein